MVSGMTEREETREKILNVAKKLIREDGVGNLSIRRIAAGAGVNVAAINYHFGSKDALILECMGEVLSSLKMTVTIFENSALEPIDRIKEYLRGISEIIVDNPEIPETLIRTFSAEKAFPGVLRNFIVEFYQKFKRFLLSACKDLDEKSAGMLVQQMISAVWFPIISYRNRTLITGFSFKDRAGRNS